MAELLFCEIARTITRTTSHDWHVQPFVKDPGKSALGGCFRLLTDSNTRPLAVVLETSQTYYAIFRAVNPAAISGVGEHRRSTPLISAEQTRNMPLQLAFTSVSARKGTRAFKFVKDLVLEVPRFPLTCRRTLSPTSSLVAEAAFLKLWVLDARFSCRTQFHPASAGDTNASC